MKIDRHRLTAAVAMLLLASAVSSCAYYNTFYLARKYYMKATDGQPYEVDREGSQQRVNYNKSADYSKKVLGVHPKSKWVDDAWLLWAKTLVGTDDPLKAVAMLQEFETRFPQSDLRPDAEFFLGLSYRAARKYELAVDRFDNFLAQAPKHELVPYAWYERSRAMLALSRAEEAAKSAGEIIDRFPKHLLVDRALRQRAEARYLEHDWAGARADFKTIGARALTDDDRFRYLLREVDCLESDRHYDEAREVLRDARSHVPAPPPPPEQPRIGVTGTVTPPPVVTASVAPGQDRYGRLTLRMGGVELLAGRLKESVEYFQTVIHDYPRTQLAAEAQYRIGYAYETGGDDFARARVEYQKVKEQTGQSQFSQQADQRLANLDRIERFRTASGADSLERKAESRFLRAEHYLFNLERPERALAEYRAIADSSESKAVVARALNAQAWVLARKLDQPKAADSLFWKVVREYPATEAQLSARDYLEAGGQTVPASLIVPPKEPERPLLDTGDSLKRPPRMTPPLGATRPPVDPLRYGNATRAALLADSLRRIRAMNDTLLAAAQRDTSVGGRARVDSLRRALLRPDTTGRAALMAEIERNLPRPEGVTIAPEGTAPNLNPDPEAEKVDLRNVSPAGPAPLPETRGIEGQAPVFPDSVGPDSTRFDSTRAVRARNATMDWLTGRNLEVRPLSRPGPLPARRSTAGNRTRPDSAAARAQRPDSLGGATTTPDFVPIEAEAAPAQEAPAEPPKPASRGITSFQRLTKAEKAALRETQTREKAVRDSLNQVKKAQKQAAKEAKKHPKPHALPDTTAIGKAKRDSLTRITAPPPAPAVPARPDSATRDSSGSRH